MSNVFYKQGILLIAMLGSYSQLLSQEISNTVEIEKTVWNYVFDHIVIVIGVIVLFGALISIYRLSLKLLELEHIKLLKEKGLDADTYFKKKESQITWQKIIDFSTSMVPVAKESSIDMGHDYDGIRELDNRLPPWWIGIMYGSIIFSVVYLYYYHFSNNDWSSENEYIAQVQEGALLKADYLFEVANAVNENNVVVLSDENDLKAGLELYTRNCVACHGSNGEGGVGPNLTDDYWIHGPGISDVFKTIKYGIPEKGMIAWQTQLRPQSMQQLASYLMTLKGTSPPNPKEPEGDLYEN